jgi:TPR repeat protein
LSAASLLHLGPALSRLFEEGPERAADWVRILAREGIASAERCYGRLLLQGTGVPQCEAEALRWFRRAALQVDADGGNMVGRCLENGWGGAVDVTLAAVHYQRAAESGTTAVREAVARLRGA